MTAQWVEAIAACIGTAIALIAVIVTAVQVTRSARQSALDSEERTRPYVSFDFEPGLWGEGAVDVVVRNHGRAAARDVRLGLKDGFPALGSADDQVLKNLRDNFSAPFDLAPGAHRRIAWRFDLTPSFGKVFGGPEAGILVAHYYWRPTSDQQDEYSERTKFDLRTLLALMPSPSAGPTRGDKNDIEKNLLTVLRAMGAHLAMLRR